mmetsp:Transcript_1403/g.4542  ORF Transcript_1403/g.4542 Transcript_1403/m.4542 type:complete len:165 (+) Transcript_1403:99-593(+)
MAALATLVFFFASVVGAQADMQGFQACILGKLFVAKKDCSTPVCTPACKEALGKVVASLDGSCCAEAPDQIKAVCPMMVQTQLVPKLKQVIEQRCPAMDFATMFDDVSVAALFEGTPEAGTEPRSAALVQTMLVAAVGGIVGAGVMFALLGRRSKPTTPASMLG